MLSSIAFTMADIILESNADYTISTNKVKVRSGKLGVVGGCFHKIIAKYMKILYPQIFFIWNSLFDQKIVLSTFFPDCPQQELEGCSSMTHSTPLQQRTCTYLF
jgi:hypothetical protein